MGSTSNKPPYSTERAKYPQSTLIKIARLYYINDLSHQEIADRLGIHPRQKVAAMAEAAKAWVHTAILPPEQEDDIYLEQLEKKVIDRFKLKRCALVYGRRKLMRFFPVLPSASTDDSELRSTREVVVDQMAAKTAELVISLLQESESQKPTIAATFGVIARKVADMLPVLPKLDKEGCVITAFGMESDKPDRFTAANIVRDMARRLGFDFRCIPFPLCMDADVVKAISETKKYLDLKEILDKDVEIVLGTVTSIHQRKPSGIYSSLLTHSFTPDELATYEKKNAVGFLGGIVFGAYGQPIETSIRSLGLSMSRMQEIVDDDKSVILSVGADPIRIPALVTAFKYRLANCWVGDDWTARVLLGDIKLPEVKIWSDEEKEILNSLAR